MADEQDFDYLDEELTEEALATLEAQAEDPIFESDLGQPGIEVDAGDVNSDWIKGTWPWSGVDTLAKLLALLKELDITPAEFKTWNVYRVNLERKPFLRGL